MLRIHPQESILRVEYNKVSVQIFPIALKLSSLQKKALLNLVEIYLKDCNLSQIFLWVFYSLLKKLDHFIIVNMFSLSAMKRSSLLERMRKLMPKFFFCDQFQRFTL